jgi:ABC-type ATPase involved in cell division
VKTILHLRNIIKRFYIGEPNELQILNGIDLDVREGEFVSIVGASGSGKTTLMNVIGLLDRPTEGEYIIDGVDVGQATDKELSFIRNQKIGFVFQTYNLVPKTTALKNVELPMLYGGVPARERTRRAKELLDLVKEVKPDLKLGVEIKEYTEENVDLSVALLKEYGVFENCWFYAFNGRIIRYLKEKYDARTMGYPDFEMGEFDGYDAYRELGLSLRYVRSEVLPFYQAKGMPIHMYCADTEEDVRMCIRKGADLITANDPRALLKVLGRSV